MAKKQVRRPTPSTRSVPTALDEARDELFQHIMTCGVIGADAEHQAEWFDETMRYLAERYDELSPVDLKQLRTLGERFVQPPKKTPSPSEAVSVA